MAPSSERHQRVAIHALRPAAFLGHEMCDPQRGDAQPHPAQNGDFLAQEDDP